MGIEYYLFAGFVFALCLILVLLLVKGLKKKKSDDEIMREEKYKKIDIIYSEITDMLDAMEVYVEESKLEITREKEKLVRYLEESKGAKINLQQLPELQLNKERILVESQKPQQAQPKYYQKGEMRLKALSLNSGGYSIGEIAEELHLSTGEVALMLKLKMQNLPKKNISS